MRDVFSYKRGMRLPSRIITLAGNGITSLDELDIGSIQFVYRQIGIAERNIIDVTIISSSLMTIEVDFEAIDTAVVAQYQWQVEATVSGLRMAFPEAGFYTFSITETIE